MFVFLMLVGLATICSASITVDEAYWQGDHNLSDIVHGYLLEVNSVMDSYQTMLIGNGISLNEGQVIKTGLVNGSNVKTIDIIFRADVAQHNDPILSFHTVDKLDYVIFRQENAQVRIKNTICGGELISPGNFIWPGSLVHIVFTQNTTGCYLYVNGTMVASDTLVEYMDDFVNFTLNYEIDFGVSDGDITIDNIVLTSDWYDSFDVAESWNGGLGKNFSDGWSGDGPVLIFNKTINLTSPNASQHVHNFTPIFNISWDTATADNCSLYTNLTGVWKLNHTLFNVANNTNTNFSTFIPAEEHYLWNVMCANGSNHDTWSKSNFTVIVDRSSPTMVDNSGLAGTDVSLDYVNLNIDVGPDYLYKIWVNVTCSNGTNVYTNETSLDGTLQTYTITDRINNTKCPGGDDLTVTVQAADTHTKKYIQYIPHTNIDKELTFNPGEKQIKFYPKDKSAFGTVSTKKEKDRHTFTYKRSKASNNYDEFYIEGLGIEQIINGNYKNLGHFVQWKGFNSGSQWLDLNTPEGYPVTVSKQGNKYVAKVDCSKDGCSKDYEFQSIGGLNENNVTFTYFFDGSTWTADETFSRFIFSSHSTNFMLNMSYNPIRFNNSIIPNITLLFNNTNYTAQTIFFNTTDARFTINLSPFIVGDSSDISHQWYINMTYLGNGTNATFNTSPQIQTLINPLVGYCNATMVSQILNITYFDEVNDAFIQIDTNGYDLNFYDGIVYRNLTGSFTTTNNNTFCTNVPAANVTYAWDMTGTFTLDKADYVTRIYTYGEGSETSISNNPRTDLALYMIGVANSTTVTYSWQTTAYQPITGLLKVYRCNADGSKSLTESVPITSGNAVANIQLLFQPYSYEVIIDGITYADASFSTCHVESSATPNYFVNIDAVDITPAIGLLLIDCTLTDLGSDTVLMSWQDVVGQSASIIGCLRMYREDLGNLTLVEEVCSNGIASTIQNTFTLVPGNNYHVKGELNQGGEIGFCQGQVNFIERGETSKEFGASGVFAVFLLILSMILLLSETGERMLLGGIVGLIGAWIIGLVSFGWAVSSSFVAFVVIIIVVGRYARK